MALHLVYSDAAWTTQTAADFIALGIVDPKLQISYAHAATLTWRMLAPQHTMPIAVGAEIQFWDDAIDPAADGGSQNKPLFEGIVWQITPSDANLVEYTAYDATARAARELYIMSDAAIFGNTVPRLVYNVKIENDDDKAFERENDFSIGDIIGDLLTDAYASLLAIHGCPPVDVGGPAYVAGDLTPLDYKSQEKIVFESETLRGGIERMMAYYSQYRLVFIPGHDNRLWRFRNVLTAPQVTLTLNQNGVGGNVPVVLSMHLDRSLEKRCTAVSIYGPERNLATSVLQSTGGLDTEWLPFEEAQFVANGPGWPGTAEVGRVWKVHDSTRRRMARLLPQPVNVNAPTMFGDNAVATMWVRVPTLLVTFDASATWAPIVGIHLDIRTGVINAPFQVFKETGNPVTPYRLPDDVQFIYSYFGVPLSVRAPASGYEGTAYTDFGLAVEMKRYDEALAVGYEYGVAVTTVERQAEFTKLAQSILDARKDVVYAGGCVLDGMQYDFLRLNRRVNFTSLNPDGSALTTGWESANAILTDVEYDYSAQHTALTFSSDHIEFLQSDPDALKRLLKIRAMVQLTWTTQHIGVGLSGIIERHFAYVTDLQWNDYLKHAVNSFTVKVTGHAGEGGGG